MHSHKKSNSLVKKKKHHETSVIKLQQTKKKKKKKKKKMQKLLHRQRIPKNHFTTLCFDQTYVVAVNLILWQIFENKNQKQLSDTFSRS